MPKLLLFILLFISIVRLHAQQRWEDYSFKEFESLIETVAEKFDMPQYYVKMKYTSFKGQQTSTPFEKSVGYYQKSKDNSCFYILGITTVTDDKYSIIIDSVNHTIGVNNSQKNTDQKALLDNYKLVQEMITDIRIKDVSGGKTVMIEYNSTSPIAKVVFQISRNNTLESITTYYANQKTYLDEDGTEKEDFVVLKIDYLELKAKKTITNLTIDKIIVESKESITLTPTYKNFELIDFRLQ